MDSLTRRGVVLVICRLMNSAILFLSPVFLVRLLDKLAYGQYREFILYAGLSVSFLQFSIRSNLLFFIPRQPDREREQVTNTILFMLLSSLGGCAVLYAGRHVLLGKTTYDFAVPLVMYLLFALNLDVYESYWLARKRSDCVLYYSVAYAALRVAATVAAAFLMHDVDAVIATLIAAEALRCLYTGGFVWRRRLLSGRIDMPLAKEQWAFFMPLGLAAVILYLNQQIGSLYISGTLGAEALAVYITGSLAIPIVSLVRSAVGDAIFPDMADRTGRDPLQGLHLWKRANVLYAFMFMPLFVVCSYYPKVIIETLFTTQYTDSVPVFQIYLIYVLRQSCELGSPLRAMNANRHFIAGGVVSFACNAVLLVILCRRFGLVGAACAFVISDVLMAVYVASRILKVYRISAGELLMWRKTGLLALASLLCLPVLPLGEVLAVPAVARAAICGLAYLGAYYAVVRSCRIEEVDLLHGKVAQFVQRFGRSSVQTIA